MEGLKRMISKPFFIKRLVNRQGNYKNGHINVIIYREQIGDLDKVVYILDFYMIDDDRVKCYVEEYSDEHDILKYIYYFVSPFYAYRYYERLYKELGFDI